MDTRTTEILVRATADFYAKECQSFSATRKAPWKGWHRVVDALPEGDQSLRVLDIGCGNMRFEKFLANRFPGRPFEVYAFDNCPELACDVGEDFEINFEIVNLCERDLPAISVPSCDLSVAFGLMHHIPSFNRRREIMDALAANTRRGGIVAVSFWQFMKSERLAKLAEKATAAGCLELGITLSSDDGDYLLGWQGHQGVYRYCHNFTDDEVDLLASGTKGCTCIETFSDDGGLNRYVILKRDVD